MANELKYHMNMLNSIDRQVGGPGNWTYIIDALNSIDQGLTSYIPDQRQAIADYVEQVIASIPPEYSVLREQAYNAYPTGTLTGNTLYFDDGANNIPVKELIANLSVKQAGSGTPSPTNVRPITGHDGVNIFRTGKNLSPGFYTGSNTGYGITFEYVQDDSVITNHIRISGTSTANNADSPRKYITGERGPTLTLRAGVAYTIKLYGTVELSNKLRIFLRDENDVAVWYGDSTTGVWTVTPETDITFMRVMFRVATTGTTVNIDAYFQIQVAASSQIYSAYRGRTEIQYTFQDTVYSGTLDVLTGVLTVDKYNLFIDPTKIPDNYIHFDVLNDVARIGNLLLDTHFSLPSSIRAKYDTPNDFRNGAVSNWSFERNKGYSSNTAGFYFSSNRAFYLFCEKSIFATQDAAGFKQYLTNNPLYICFTLQTPITYQLAPSEMTTLLMGNTVWTDDGSIRLTYRADTTTVINKLKEA